MFTLNVILAAVIAAFFTMAGAGKLADLDRMEEARLRLGVTPTLWKTIAGLELAGAAGVLLGLFDSLTAVGVLAAVGLIAMTIGAVAFHQKAGDTPKEWLPGVVLGSLTIFYIITRIATA